MRRLQLGSSSMGSSVDASNPPTRPSQTQRPAQSQSQSQAGQNQPAQSQNTGQAAQSQSANTAASKSSSIDNNIAAPRKECESVVSVAPKSQENICVVHKVNYLSKYNQEFGEANLPLILYVYLFYLEQHQHTAKEKKTDKYTYITNKTKSYTNQSKSIKKTKRMSSTRSRQKHNAYKVLPLFTIS